MPHAGAYKPLGPPTKVKLQPKRKKNPVASFNRKRKGLSMNKIKEVRLGK